MAKKEKETRKPELNIETFNNNLISTAELIREGFLPTESRFGLGELAETPSFDMYSPQVNELDAWIVASEDNKKSFLRNMIIALGLTVENLTQERAKRTYKEDGIRGTPSEGGAEIMVFDTQFPRLELHVLQYNNSDMGTKYDLVVYD